MIKLNPAKVKTFVKVLEKELNAQKSLPNFSLFGEAEKKDFFGEMVVRSFVASSGCPVNPPKKKPAAKKKKK